MKSKQKFSAAVLRLLCASKPIAGERSVRLEALADKSEVALTNANGGNRFHGTVDMLEAILRPSEAEPEA